MINWLGLGNILIYIIIYIRKYTVLAQSRQYPSICMEGLKKLTKASVMVAGFQTETRTGRLPYTGLQRDRRTNLLCLRGGV
jgi:hypothetical protein